MVYADYDFYTAVYGGKTISADDWPALAMRASAYIDTLTFGRLAAGVPVDDAVRLAVCAVAETEQRWAQAEARPAGLASASNDGYSETYANADRLAAQRGADRLAAMDLYLPRSHPLRYAGVM